MYAEKVFESMLKRSLQTYAEMVSLNACWKSLFEHMRTKSLRTYAEKIS